ncbi:MAG: carbohydrate ABC transporter permease, partial [Clostridia bacterium]|nr:carbohydrate ABC transporter permease [Clostridia bacterium]
MAEKAMEEMKKAHDKHMSKINRTFGDYVISFITYVVYAFFAFVCVYPFYYIIINSISANNLSEKGKVIFYPMEIHFTNYKNLANIPGLTQSAFISVMRTLVGTILTVIIAAFLGYMFTRQTLWKRKFWYRFVVITMYFNAGLIPWYLAMKTLGMTNNFLGYILPTAIQPFY